MAAIDLTRESRVAYYKDLVDEDIWPLGRFASLSKTLQEEVEGRLIFPEDKYEIVNYWTSKYLVTPKE